MTQTDHFSRMINLQDRYQSSAASNKTMGVAYTGLAVCFGCWGGKDVLNIAQTAINRQENSVSLRAECQVKRPPLEEPITCAPEFVLGVTAVALAAITAVGCGYITYLARSHFRSSTYALEQANIHAEKLKGQAQVAQLVKQKWGLGR